MINRKYKSTHLTFDFQTRFKLSNKTIVQINKKRVVDK